MYESSKAQAWEYWRLRKAVFARHLFLQLLRAVCDAAMCAELEGWLCTCPHGSAGHCPTEERQEVHMLGVIT